MTSIPANALMASRAILPDPVIDCTGRERVAIEEVVTKRDGTKFWHWIGWYAQMAKGPVRCTYSARVITREQAVEHAARMDAID